MKNATAPIPFAGSHLDQTRHVCAIFNSADAESRVLLPLVQNELLVTALLSGVYRRFDTRFGALFCVEVKP